MIILDHNIPEDQAQQLRGRRIHFRQIGVEVGRPEWDDQQEILRFLHATKQITFFTRDLGFFRPSWRHANYCLVTLTVPVLETAHYISKLLRHPQWESHKGFNKEHKLLGYPAAAAKQRRLVNGVALTIELLRQSPSFDYPICSS